MKKFLLGTTAIAAAVVLSPLFAAFEAHVINVTAKIENALSVPTEAISFGTVFPQEHLEKDLAISLSQSFMDERRVDDVEYFIRQKPKCGVTNQDEQNPNDNGTELLGPTWTGHIVVGDNPFTEGVTETYYVDCDADRPDQVLQHPNPQFWLLPSLCEYISKEGPDENDGHTYSFHKPFAFVTVEGDDPLTTVVETNPGLYPLGKLVWNDTLGRLAKSDTDNEDQIEGDTVDNWIIDLSVPCFGGFCAQDWATFVDEQDDPENPANPEDYTQPIANEHKIFGCNLWVEVYNVSPAGEPEPETATLTVDKIVTFTSDTVIGVDVNDFALTIDGPIPGPGDSQLVTDETPVVGLAAGVYTVTELYSGLPPGIVFDAIFSGACSEIPVDTETGTVTLAPGDNVTCTLTNQVDPLPL